MTNTWLCEGAGRIEQLSAEHEVVQVERGSRGSFEYGPSHVCRMLPVTLTIEVVADTVEDAYRIAKQSLDPRLDVSIHTVRRV